MKIRQSYIRAFDACEMSARLYETLDVDTYPLIRGRAGHRTVELCIKAMQEHGETRISPDDAKAILHAVLDEFPVPARELDFLRVMVAKWATHFELPPNAMVEQPVSLMVGDVNVTGTIDLLWVEGDTAHIRDWKFGYFLPKQEDISGSDNGRLRGARAAQLIVYSLLVADGDFPLPAGVNKFDCAFQYPNFATDEYGIAERGITIDRPELIEHRLWLENVVGRIVRARETDTYRATPGSHCSSCPAPKSCPLPKELIPGLSPFEDGPEHVAQQWLVFDREAKRLQEELKAYAAQMGPIPVGTDQELGFSTIASSRLSPAAKRALEAGETPRGEVFKQSTSSRFGLRKRAA